MLKLGVLRQTFLRRWFKSRRSDSAYSRRTELGHQGERAAEKYLHRRGYRILHRNLRNPAGEIDLVVENGGIIVFVEVKTRQSGSPHSGLEAVDATKRMQICRAATYYLSEYREKVVSRFDIMVVEGNGEQVQHYPDAFRPESMMENDSLEVVTPA